MRVNSLVSTTGFDTASNRRPLLMVHGWWILAFVVSFFVFSSVLAFVGEQAHANPLDGALGSSGSKGGGQKGGGSGDGNQPSLGGAAGARGGGGSSGPIRDASGGVGGLNRGGSDNPVSVNGNPGGIHNPSVGGPPLADRAAEPISEAVGPAAGKIAEPVADKGAEATQPLLKEVSPLTGAVQEATAPVTKPVDNALGTVEKELAPVTAPVDKAADPVLAPVQGALGDLTEPVREMASPVISPGSEGTNSLASPVDAGETQIPAIEPAVSNPLVGPPLGQLPEAVEPDTLSKPVNGAGDTALLLTEPLFDKASFERVALQSELASSIQPNPESSPAGSPVEKKQASSVKPDAPVISRSLVGETLAALVAPIYSWVDHAMATQMPQPFPTGAMPAAGSSASGSGSSSGSGGSGGFDLGALALLSLLLLSGKFLWSVRDLLRPSTALVPILERPG